MVNCQAGGSCDGGDPAVAYEFAYNTGFVDSSCEQYTAQNLEGHLCDHLDVCRDCSWPPPAVGDSGLEGCRTVPAVKYFVSEYYQFLVVLMLPQSSTRTRAVSFHKFWIVQLRSTTKLKWLATAFLQMARSTGSVATHGVPTGETTGSSTCRCTRTTFLSRLIAPAVFHPTWRILMQSPCRWLKLRLFND